VHPGHAVALHPYVAPHCWQVYAGVPWHVGPTGKTSGGSGTCSLVVLQQICPVQSLLALHDFGHVFWQMPPQQSGFVESQSLDALHVLGQACAPE
jgi:hypothetical protein